MAHIGILQFNDISDPFVGLMKDELTAGGFIEGDNAIFIVRNAGGDITQLRSLVDTLLKTGIDIMVSFSTPATQAAVALTPDSIPIIFSIVTNPSGAGILNQRAGVTGLSDAPDFNAFISFTIRLFPGLSVAGSLYNSEESNSVFAQQQLHDASVFFGLDFFNASVISADDIPSAYATIIQDHVEVILITGDNTMTMTLPQLIALATPDLIPVLGTDYVNAQDGALASISVNYDLIARETGKLVVTVIRGVNPDDVPVKYFDTNIIAINTQTAENLGYVFDPGIISEARYIYP
jgi:putative ABC transport system substrate-binding protein